MRGYIFVPAHIEGKVYRDTGARGRLELTLVASATSPTSKTYCTNMVVWLVEAGWRVAGG